MSMRVHHRLYDGCHITPAARRRSAYCHPCLEVVDQVCDQRDEDEQDQNDQEDDNIALHFGMCGGKAKVREGEGCSPLGSIFGAWEVWGNVRHSLVLRLKLYLQSLFPLMQASISAQEACDFFAMCRYSFVDNTDLQVFKLFSQQIRQVVKVVSNTTNIVKCLQCLQQHPKLSTATPQECDNFCTDMAAGRVRAGEVGNLGAGQPHKPR